MSITRLTPKLLSWATLLEPETEQQAARTAALPFVQPHVALMPDAHLGKGATVGSVIPTLGAIIPAAVGVDIGCGMTAVRTQLTAADLPSALAPLRVAIEDRIPVSAGGYNAAVTQARTADRLFELAARAAASDLDLDRFAPNWRSQLGSLGSGNHFIEVSLDGEDRVWLFLHSGSRGVGNKIAQHHIAVARELMKRWWIELADPDLAYLVQGTAEFDAYLAGLLWAQEFARLNRAEMMDRVVDAVEQTLGIVVERSQEIDCHHNYSAMEHHFGRDLWVSRKGAILAREGVWGLIPGSMGTRSYVVRGRGHRASLDSAPHGAGRALSRSAARRTFTAAQLAEAMTGIEYRVTDAFVDEIPQAYKPIDQVMADAADLVEVVFELRQVVNVKGD